MNQKQQQDRRIYVYKDGKELTRVMAAEREVVISDLKANTIYGFKVVDKYSNGKKSKPVSVNTRTSKKKIDKIKFTILKI